MRQSGPGSSGTRSLRVEVSESRNEPENELMLTGK
jgi:hypothetical protein